MYLITGSKGLLGSEFRERLSNKEAYFTDSKMVDICNIHSIRNFVTDKKIDVIINCAAIRDAEALEDNVELGQRINVDGPRNLAIVAKEIGATIIHFSTDYVFDGNKSFAYTEADDPNPLSVYGKTKLQGEKEVIAHAETALVIRTSWLFSIYGKDFVKTVRNLALQKSEIKVVFDQTGSPCYAADLAEHVLNIASQIKLGNKEIYHLSNRGICSWYDLAHLTIKGFGLKNHVVPIHSAEYPTKAKRPRYSVLDSTKIVTDYNLKIRHYSDALIECINKIQSL